MAVISQMESPLGRCVGNSLEVKESLDCLRGGGSRDLRELVVLEGGYNIDTIAQSSLYCTEALLSHSHNLQTPSVTPPQPSAVETVNSVVRQLAPYWKSLPR